MAAHTYDTTTLGTSSNVSQVELARVLRTTPARIAALQRWPVPDEDAQILAKLILMQHDSSA